MICWMGPKLGGDEIAKTSEAIDILCNHELSSDMSRARVNKGSESEDFLMFFPKGFIILNGPRVPMQDVADSIKQHGTMFRS